MTKTERIIEYLNSMSDYDLVSTIANICYQNNFYCEQWMDMNDFDEVMEDVEPSYTVQLALDAGHDFDIGDEYFITDKVNYLYSGTAEEAAEWIRNDIPEYARIIVDYGIDDTGDNGLDSIIERGDN